MCADLCDAHQGDVGPLGWLSRDAATRAAKEQQLARRAADRHVTNDCTGTTEVPMRSTLSLIHAGLVVLGALHLMSGCAKKCPPGYGLVNDVCRPVLVGGAPGTSAEATSANSGDQAQTAAPEDGKANAGSGAKSQMTSTPQNSAPGTSQPASGGVGTQGAVPGTNGGEAGSAAERADEPSASANDGSQEPIGPCTSGPAGTICEGATLHECDGNGMVVSSETCMSEAFCQIGTTSGACAQCVPDSFQCEAEQLKQCSAEGQWVDKEVCASAALCKEAAGACTEMVCMPNMATCSSDGATLRICNEDGSDFADQQNCGAGLCDAAAGKCNKCMPGMKTCNGNALVTCSADGQNVTEVVCMPSGGECATASCRNNACVPGIKPLSSPCTAGKCDATGRCVACITSSDCPDPGPCNDRTCTLGACGTRVKGAGSCPRHPPALLGCTCLRMSRRDRNP